MSLVVISLEIYQTAKGKQPFVEWLESLSDARARAKIKVRLARLRLNNMGDYKTLGNGLYELRIDEGGGYRVYFAQDSNKKVLLLGGSKKSQPRDIAKAREYLQDYHRS